MGAFIGSLTFPKVLGGANRFHTTLPDGKCRLIVSATKEHPVVSRFERERAFICAFHTRAKTPKNIHRLATTAKQDGVVTTATSTDGTKTEDVVGKGRSMTWFDAESVRVVQESEAASKDGDRQAATRERSRQPARVGS